MFSMNKLTTQTRVQILSMLCEGSSMRAISRVCDVSINTVSKLLIDAGLVCARFHDDNVRGVKAQQIQADEIWSFCYAKAKNVATAKAAPEKAGDVWTWTALDRDSKLIVSYLIGGRDTEYALAFMDDLRQRVDGRFQLSTDGHYAYVPAVEEAFGSEIDYAMVIKIYGDLGKSGERKYSPDRCIGQKKDPITGNPDRKMISTSHVERSNLSLRMHNRRFTRLTNAHSKKFENHCHMIALYTVWYNYARINSAVKMAPAMAAGISDRLWSMTDIVGLIDQAEGEPRQRGPYKKRPV